MKLASLKSGRNGRLVVVSDTLEQMLPAPERWSTLQAALDDWAEAEPQLQALADQLGRSPAAAKPFAEKECAALLPRAYQWIDGSAYINHVELVRRARGAEMPEHFYYDPLMYQGVSAPFLGPCDPVCLPQSEGWGIDFEGEVAVITGDVPMGASRELALDAVCLVLLVNDISLRGLIPDELAKGFGFLQSKPPCSTSPVAVTPAGLGDLWQGGKLHMPLLCTFNGALFGRANAGLDMTFDFGTLIAHAAKTRPLPAGTVIGSGTVSNKLNGGPGKPVSVGGAGYSCIAELRMIEQIEAGDPCTPFMVAGDRIQMEMRDQNGRSIFGMIDQRIETA